jgi:hypothetical protein
MKRDTIERRATCWHTRERLVDYASWRLSHSKKGKPIALRDDLRAMCDRVIDAWCLCNAQEQPGSERLTIEREVLLKEIHRCMAYHTLMRSTGAYREAWLGALVWLATSCFDATDWGTMGLRAAATGFCWALGHR